MVQIRSVGLGLAFALTLNSGAARLLRAKGADEKQPLGWAPPAPEGEAPAKGDDLAYNSKDDACAACKFYATGSCAMYKTCLCHATNAFFGIAGIPEPSDKDNWHYSCGASGGSKYELCFTVTGTYMDNFGDKIDPNNLKCPE